MESRRATQSAVGLVLWYRASERTAEGEETGNCGVPEIDNAIPRLPLPPTNDVGGRSALALGSPATAAPRAPSSCARFPIFLRFLFLFVPISLHLSFLAVSTLATIFLLPPLQLLAFFSSLSFPSTSPTLYSPILLLLFLSFLLLRFLLPLSLRELLPGRGCHPGSSSFRNVNSINAGTIPPALEPSCRRE